MSILDLKERLHQYKKKYFLSKLLKGSILFITISLIISLLALFIDYILQPGVAGRTFIFYTSLAFITLNFIYFLVPYLLGYFNVGTFKLEDEEVAKEIGIHFSEIGDKIINALQLENLAEGDKELIFASIDQKIASVQSISFKDAINIKVNFVYLRYTAIVVLVFLLTGLSFPSVITNSPERILKHRTYFEEALPFEFSLLNEKLEAFKGDDFIVNASMSGSYVPEELYINLDGRRVKMKKDVGGRFSHKFSALQRSLKFNLEAGGYSTEDYTLNVYPLPELLNFEVLVDYPNHTQIKDYQISGTGSFTVPEGTVLSWLIKSSNTDSIAISVADKVVSEKLDGDVSEQLKYDFRSSSDYQIVLFNDYGTTREKIEYRVDVIKDEFPEIEATVLVDTLLYEFAIISGSVRDDYGFTNLYSTLTDENKEKSTTKLSFNAASNNQSFYARIDLTDIEVGENVTLTATVTDNDKVNGFKSASTKTFRIRKPTKSEIDKNIADKEKNTEQDLTASQKKAQELKDRLKELEERLRMKNKMDWQEEKMIDDLLEDRKKIEEQIKKLQSEFKELQTAENQFNERSERLQEKSENLEQILNETMDPETQKLYDELQKLMEENAGVEQIQKQLSKITPNESNLEKELERALELFKRLKLESKLEKTAKDLENLGEEQENLAQQENEGSSEPKGDNQSEQNKEGDEKEGDNKGSNEDEQKEGNENGEEGDQNELQKQEDIEKKYEDIQKQIEDIQKMNQDLKQPEPLQNTNSEQQEIQEQLEKIKEQLKNNQKQQAQQGQKQSGQKMKDLGKKMQNMQMGMQMEMMMENIDDLRKILDDLIRLSFKQEELIDGFREVKQVDPRFVELSQDQLKLKNDSKVIEDSLLALASRVDQISSFVTREVAAVNENIDKALDNLKDRDRNRALSNQQYAMTSINNLALLLDDVLQNMQMSMAQSMGNPQQSDGQNSNMPDLKELQQQLSEQIQNLQKGEKEGRELSEELARLAAEQEMIRNQLKQVADKLDQQSTDGDKPGSNLTQIMKLMEQNEVDLVNKEITRRLIQRQKDIMTRLLEAEVALREQKLDQERKGESAEDYEREIPASFEEYLKERQKEIELLKSLPLEFNPFYKKEVNDYFRRVTSDN